jgi:serine/threonine protein kinase
MALGLFRRRFQIADYEILDKIDEGSRGAVYKARSQATGEMVAVKIIKNEFAQHPTLLKRLKQEFRVASKLIHPNIVQALAFGQDESGTYLVLEYVEGESLWQRVVRDGRLEEADAIRIITQVAQGLHYAHKQGMIHRDVKPDNILLKANGQAKLTDFGLVKNAAEDLQLTGPSSVLGTPHFMAPEQYTNPKGVDARCDVYALAASLYLAVTGHLPFEADTALETLKMQANDELISPRALVPSLSEQIDRAIRRAMRPDPAKRHPSCVAFTKDLKERKRGRAAVDTAQVQVDRGQPFKGAERRASVRFPCIMGTAITLETCFHPGADESNEDWPATVEDLSQGGLALILGRRLEPGTMLKVELTGTDPTRPHVLLVRVMNVRPHGPTHWRVGGAFPQPLSREELQGLL